MEWVILGKKGKKRKDCRCYANAMCGINVEGLHQKVGAVCGKAPNQEGIPPWIAVLPVTG